MLVYVIEVREAGKTYDVVNEAKLQVCTAKPCLCTYCTPHHQYLSLQVQQIMTSAMLRKVHTCYHVDDGVPAPMVQIC